MSANQQRQRFRDILAGAACISPASVFDPISARIAEDLGYELGMFAGSVAALTILGAPDLVLITLSEFAAQARRICRAGTLPLLVDADHGYGNALNVMRTVEELDAAGVAALTIEDTVLPKAFGGGAPLLSIEEGAGKLRAAVEARADGAIVVAGRTGALSQTSVSDAIERVRAYQGLGIDAMFLSGVQERAQLEAVAEVATIPLILGSVPKDMADPAYLASRGVRIALRGHQPIMAAIQAVYDTMRELRSDAPNKDALRLASKELLAQTTRDEQFRRYRKDYLEPG
jgi:oxaloacetate decarboxylase